MWFRRFRSSGVFVLLLGCSFPAFSEVGDVYYCETTQVRDVNSDGTDETFRNFRFKFQRERTQLILGDDDNWYKGSEFEVLWGVSKAFTGAMYLPTDPPRPMSVFTYAEGHWAHSATSFRQDDSGEVIGVFGYVITATCSPF